jgi:hypothetical protein
MAKPIPIQLSKRDPQEELRSRLEKAPDQHAEALLASLDVLQSLHDQGVLELLRGVLGGGNKILEILVDAGKSPEAIRGIRNLVIMTKIVGSMDPESQETCQSGARRLGGCGEGARITSARSLGNFADAP